MIVLIAFPVGTLGSMSLAIRVSLLFYDRLGSFEACLTPESSLIS